MTVFIVGKFYVESFALHIAETFQKMGHEVVRCEYGIAQPAAAIPLRYQLQKVANKLFSFVEHTPVADTQFLQKMLRSCRHKKIDLILSCHDFLTPQQVRALKQATAAQVALWFPDPIHHFHRAMFLNAEYDFLFFKEPYMVQVLGQELNIKSFYLPECCNPEYHRRVDLSPIEVKKFGCQLTTAGNMHAARVAFFSQFTNYSMKLWGNPAPYWMQVGNIRNQIMNEFVSNETKCKAFQGADIVLNNLFPSEIYGVNVRTFEIAAAGAFQLINYRKALPDLYELDTEIISFSSIQEAKDKVDYYLDHPEARKRIAEKAYQRTHAEHTYTHRLQRLLDTIEGKAAGYGYQV